MLQINKYQCHLCFEIYNSVFPYYVHCGEKIYYCSIDCLNVILEHECGWYCRLLKRCIKCNFKYLVNNCVKNTTWRCKFCQRSILHKNKCGYGKYKQSQIKNRSILEFMK